MASLKKRHSNTKVVIVGMLKRIFEGDERSVVRQLMREELSYDQLYLAKVQLDRLTWLIARALRGPKTVKSRDVPATKEPKGLKELREESDG